MSDHDDGKVAWIGSTDNASIRDAQGYVNSLTDEDTQGILVYRMTKNGGMEMRTFGKLTVADTCLAGASLQHAALEALGMYGEDD